MKNLKILCNGLDKLKISFLIAMFIVSLQLKSQSNLDSLLQISSEIIPLEIEKDFPKFTQVLYIVKRDDKYLKKIYFGNYFFKAPSRVFSKEGLVFIDKSFILNQNLIYENAILWDFLIRLGTIHASAENTNMNVNYVFFNKVKFNFALSSILDIVKQTGDCKLAKFGLNAIFSGSKKMVNDLNQKTALEQIVEEDLYKRLEEFYLENKCVAENGALPKNSSPLSNLKPEAITAIKKKIEDLNLKKSCFPSSPELLEKSLELLKDFDSTINLNQNVTSYKYKSIPERFYYSTVFAKIIKNKQNCYSFLLIFYDKEGNANTFDLSFNDKRYTFKKGTTNNSGQVPNIFFTPFLINSTETFKSLQEFLNDRDASIFLNGFKTEKIDISSRERKFIQKTLDLYISLTNLKFD